MGNVRVIEIRESVFADNTTLSLKEEDVDHVFDGYKNGKA